MLPGLVELVVTLEEESLVTAVSLVLVYLATVGSAVYEVTVDFPVKVVILDLVVSLGTQV